MSTARGRAQLTALVVVGAFVLSGGCTPSWPAALLGEPPVDADVALRAVALGLFPESRTAPLTLVTIDAATDSAWGRPAVTPRPALARLIDVISAGGARALVVDVDLSWGDATAVADTLDRALVEHLRGYAGHTPLVFPKRLVTQSDGSRRAAWSPLDVVVEEHPRLSWAHASFDV